MQFSTCESAVYVVESSHLSSDTPNHPDRIRNEAELRLAVGDPLMKMLSDYLGAKVRLGC